MFDITDKKTTPVPFRSWISFVLLFFILNSCAAQHFERQIENVSDEYPHLPSIIVPSEQKLGESFKWREAF